MLVEVADADCEVQGASARAGVGAVGPTSADPRSRSGKAARAACSMIGSRVCVSSVKSTACVCVGAAQRLLLAGYSSVAQACAEFAVGLGFEVILCDPRDEVLEGVVLENVEIRRQLPSVFIADGGCHSDTAVVALTHDPRIDDLAMMEAVCTEAFYIGVMGSMQTSQKRFERLRRIGGSGGGRAGRIHAPIGLEPAQQDASGDCFGGAGGYPADSQRYCAGPALRSNAAAPAAAGLPARDR